MERFRARFLILIGILVLMAVLVNALAYDVLIAAKTEPSPFGDLPMRVGDWQGQDHFLEDWVYELLETRHIIHRRYTDGRGRVVFLSVVHYSDTKVGFHTPEQCLGAQGVELVKETRAVDLPPAGRIGINELTYGRDQSKELVFYFYKAGNYLGSSYVNLRMHIALNKLIAQDRSGSLIRVSTTVPENSPQKAETRLIRFLTAFYPVMNERL